MAAQLQQAQQQQTENKNVRQKEKKRTECINRAFSELRRCIPNVPSDTKLSKIKTLRLASSYIAYLSELLQGSSTSSSGGAEARSGAKEFHAEMQMLRGKDKYSRSNQILEPDPQASYTSVRGDCQPARKPNEPLEKKKGRTGWPEAVWAEALEANERPAKAKVPQGHMILDESSYFLPHHAGFQMDFDDQTPLSCSPPQYISDEYGVMYTNAERVLVQQCDVISPENEPLMTNLYQPAMGLQAAPTPPSAPGCVCFTDKPPPLPSIYTLSCGDKFQGQKSAAAAYPPDTSIDEPQLVELQTVVTSQHRDYRQHLLSSVGSGLLARDEDGCLS